MARTKAEEAFIDQNTRKLTVEWAEECIENDHLGTDFDEPSDPYVEYALEKGWLTKSTPRRLSSKGFSTAARFLKR